MTPSELPPPIRLPPPSSLPPPLIKKKTGCLKFLQIFLKSFSYVPNRILEAGIAPHQEDDRSLASPIRPGTGRKQKAFMEEGHGTSD